MRLYAIRDRLIDYFLTPFVAHEDKGVLNSIANLVSNEESNDPVKQAPHHFEVWRLAEIDEQGHVNLSREFLADCSTLIRARPGRQPARSGESPVETIESLRRATAGMPPRTPGAYERAAQAASQAADRERAENPQGTGGPDLSKY